MIKYLILLAKITLSTGLVWFAFHRLDLSGAWTSLVSIPIATVMLAIALFLIQSLVSAYRLQELLRQLGQKLRLLTLVGVGFVGAFFSQTLISFVGGDAMRIWRLVRFGVPASSATKSIVLDRIAGFGGIVVVLLASIPFLVPLLESLEMRLGLLLVVCGALGFILSVFVLRRMPEAMKSGRILGALWRFASLGLEIARSGRGAVNVLGLSVLIQVANVMILYVLARGLSINITLGMCFLFMPTVLFLSMLPISVAGWGVREGAMVAALAVVGVPSHQSLALSISFGLCLVLVSLPGGVIWFVSRRHLTTPAESLGARSQ